MANKILLSLNFSILPPVCKVYFGEYSCDSKNMSKLSFVKFFAAL